MAKDSTVTAARWTASATVLAALISGIVLLANQDRAPTNPPSDTPLASSSTPAEPQLTVSPSVIPIGETFMIRGSGFAPAATVDLYLHNQSPEAPSGLFGQYEADATGSFRAISRQVTDVDCSSFPVQLVARVDDDAVATATVRFCPT